MTLQATTTTNLLTRPQLRNHLIKGQETKNDQLAARFTSSKTSATVPAPGSVDRQFKKPAQEPEPSHFKKSIFKIILIQIKLLIAIVRFLNVTCLQIYYFLYFNLERLKYLRGRGQSPVVVAAVADSSISSDGPNRSLMSTLSDDHSQKGSAESSLLHRTGSSLDTSRPPNTFSLSHDSSSSSSSVETPFAQENNFRITELVHVPSHVCVIFNEYDREPRYDLFETIGNVMSANDVKMLSFYSFKDIPSEIKNGILSRFQVKFDENNNNVTKSKTSKIDNDFSYNETVINNRKVKVTNPNEKSHVDEARGQIKINFLSFASNGGQSVLAKVARSMASKVSEGLMSLGEINQEMIETHIIEEFDFVEPQLVISVGESDSLAGFSPWHLRLCEIFKVESPRLINAYTLRDILVKFSKIEKRFGK